MNVEQLVIENAGWIRRKAQSYYSISADADDLASETIFKCLNQAHRFDSDMSFKPWVTAIMANTFITQYNRRKRVLFTRYNDYDLYLGEECADQRASVRRILSIIRQCSRKSCCIECVLLYAKGFSYEEIALKQDIPVGTVKSRISTGRKILKKALG